MDKKYHTNPNHYKFKSLFNADSNIYLLNIIDCINNASWYILYIMKGLRKPLISPANVQCINECWGNFQSVSVLITVRAWWWGITSIQFLLCIFIFVTFSILLFLRHILTFIKFYTISCLENSFHTTKESHLRSRTRKG